MTNDNGNRTFDLKTVIADGLSKLRKIKLMPSLVYVSVCTDKPKDVEGLMLILRAWPKVRALLHDSHDFVSLNEMRTISQGSNIVLIDESLGDFSTDLFVSMLKKHFPNSVIASIASGAKPEWAKWHFANKQAVMHNKEAALGFMAFMDSLLRQESNTFGYKI